MATIKYKISTPTQLPYEKKKKTNKYIFYSDRTHAYLAIPRKRRLKQPNAAAIFMATATVILIMAMKTPNTSAKYS